jgi:dolichol-phosphate mannosyltransferase
MSVAPVLTVLIPALNEAESIEAVVREARDQIMARIPATDLIVIDDGSTDGTAAALKSLIAEDPRIRLIIHPKRSGKSAALRSGMLQSRSAWVATMDADGQDDPASILDMADAIDLTVQGDIGIVAGCRTNRTDGGSRRIASRIANAIRRTLLKDNCPDTGYGLKLIQHDIFLAMPFFDALHRYLPAMTGYLGWKTANVPVNNRPRAAGVSKYTNLGRAVAGLFDLIGVVWLMRRTSVPDPNLLYRRLPGEAR